MIEKMGQKGIFTVGSLFSDRLLVQESVSLVAIPVSGPHLWLDAWFDTFEAESNMERDCMEHLVWDSLYSVGIKGMDRQHQKLIEIINLFLELETQVLTRQKLLSILNNLIKYTQFHFDDEEKLMSHYNYPKLAAHKQQHDALLDEVFQLRELLDAEGILKITPRIKQFMETWLFEHIVHHDKAYGEFINQMQSK